MEKDNRSISQKIIAKLVDKISPTEAEYCEFYQELLKGNLNSVEIGSVLTALCAKGESFEDVMIAVRCLRKTAEPFPSLLDAIDIVGTGGDKQNTLNISTATAMVLAASGVKVAKHGNKSVSSSSGASDLLSELGFNILADKNQVEKSIQQTNFGFLFAPIYNPGLKHAAQARAIIGLRSIFNILGPLVNPANVGYYLIGVYDPVWLDLYAKILSELSACGYAVHSECGCDELTTMSSNKVVSFNADKVAKSFDINPTDLGFNLCKPCDIKGGDPKYNAQKLIEVFEGDCNAYYDNIVLNCAAGLLVVKKAANLSEGIVIAKEVIASKKPLSLIDTCVKISNE